MNEQVEDAKADARYWRNRAEFLERFREALLSSKALDTAGIAASSCRIDTVEGREQLIRAVVYAAALEAEEIAREDMA